jgi:hypothetical protein
MHHKQLTGEQIIAQVLLYVRIVCILFFSDPHDILGDGKKGQTRKYENILAFHQVFVEQLHIRGETIPRNANQLHAIFLHVKQTKQISKKMCQCFYCLLQYHKQFLKRLNTDIDVRARHGCSGEPAFQGMTTIHYIKIPHTNQFSIYLSACCTLHRVWWQRIPSPASRFLQPWSQYPKQQYREEREIKNPVFRINTTSGLKLGKTSLVVPIILPFLMQTPLKKCHWMSWNNQAPKDYYGVSIPYSGDTHLSLYKFCWYFQQGSCPYQKQSTSP